MDKFFPKWVLEAIRSAPFEETKEVSRTGYILDIPAEGGRIDVQFYEPVGGRHIVTLDAPAGLGPDMEKGIVYDFRFESRRAPLPQDVIAYLRDKQDLEMDAVYQFELKGITPVKSG